MADPHDTGADRGANQGDRAQRLAAALRANLRRRKGQAREGAARDRDAEPADDQGGADAGCGSTGGR